MITIIIYYYAGTKFVDLFIPGISLSLRGIPIANNSYVDVDSIGSNENGALICCTDMTDCCTSTLSPGGVEIGHWYTPGGDNLEALDIPIEPMASGMGEMMPSLVIRGQSLVLLIQVVKLVTIVDLGQFYCEVPDAKGETQRVYVNLCKLQTTYVTKTYTINARLTPTLLPMHLV